MIGSRRSHPAEPALTPPQLFSAQEDETHPVLRRQVRPAVVPLSYPQQRLWLTAKLHANDTAWHTPVVVRITGTLDVAALHAAVADIVHRHEPLRTVFPLLDGQPHQRVLPVADIGTLVVAEHVEPADLDAALQRIVRADFDLTVDIPLRVRLLTVGPGEHVLALVLHHIAADESSMEPLMRDLSHAYKRRCADHAPQWTDLPVQYADFALWQRDSDELAEGRLKYWTDLLTGVPEELALPADRVRPAAGTYRGDSVALAVPVEVHEAAAALARRSGTSVFTVLRAAVAALLFRLGAGADIPLGWPVSGRVDEAFDDLVGLFVNTLVLRADLSGDPTFEQLLARVGEQEESGLSNQDVPFERLVETLNPARVPGRHPLFQVMVALRIGPSAAFDLAGGQLRPVPIGSGSAQLDLSFQFEEYADAAGRPAGMGGELTYACDLFDRDTAERMVAMLGRLLAGAVAEPGRPVARLPLMSADDRRAVEAASAGDVRDWTDQPWIHQLIEERARLTPDATAVRFDGASLAYAELNRRANQLAHRLIRLGVGRDVLAGISMERGFDLVVAVLAVWKAGGAYVPLDPDLPPSRRALMIADTGAVVVLTHRALRSRLGEADDLLLCVDDRDAGLAAEPAHDPEVPVTGEDTAYVIYTSGSTGTPKGVVNVRAGVRNRLAWMTEKFALGHGDRVLQKSPFTFDTSVWELFWPLMSGATLVMARPDGHRDSRYLVDVIRDEKVTFADFVPSMLEAFLREPAADQCTSLRHVIAGGEALTRTLRSRFFAVLPATRLYNLYGPTEASIGVTSWECRPDDDDRRLPIGFPIANARVYVLGPGGEQTPPGVPGEICIGGRPVARGYLNRPDLTAQRFVADPFVPGARMYRTGDLGRRRGDGALEFLGRVDEQVKIRGVRIELGEVEAGLLSLTGVGQAAATVHGQGVDRRLVAYLVPESGALDPGVLRREMAAAVPDYLMPSAFVVLNALPVTVHGKVDRAALTDPGAVVAERDYQPPAGAVEETLARLWAEALGIARVGRDDNFFALGGQSLLAMQLVNRVRSVLGVNLPFRAVFESSTLAELADRLGSLPVLPADAGSFGAEERMRKLVAEALEIDQVAADDNIFDLGGDRDTIERLTRSIEQEFGVALNPLVVAAVPTAKDLAGRVGAGPDSSPMDVMVPLRPGTGRTSLFCVHPLGGLSWLYYPLVHAIPETVGVYGIQARGLRPGDTLPPTMTAMAADYINEIRAVQPEGPYHLLGLSVGGEIAHEIAVQLQRAGQQVALLAMLDARPTPYRAGTGVARLNAAERPARSTEELFAELRQRQGPYAFLLQQRGRAIVDLYKNMATLMGSHTYSTYDGDVLFVEATAGRAPEQYFAPMWEQYVTGQIEVMALNYVHRGLARAEVLEMIGARVAEHIEGFNHRGG